jgi:hypothetical protein
MQNIKGSSKNLPLTLLLWRRTKVEAIKKGFLEVPLTPQKTASL